VTVSLGAPAAAPVVLPQQRASLDALRTVLPGLLAEPHEQAYAAHATPWNVAVPMAPAAVVAVRTAQDVATTVRFARSAGLTVGVQATGHGAVASLAGHLLVSTKGLDEVTVHPEGWARIGAGVPWSRVIEAAAPHGLAPLNGSSSGVGVVGYLTGGGVGPMARTHGLACDKVRAFEVVTGDGVLRRVTPTEHADLFFALRGGKGAVGIVTAVETDLVPVAEFYGGALFFDGADAPSSTGGATARSSSSSRAPSAGSPVHSNRTLTVRRPAIGGAGAAAAAGAGRRCSSWRRPAAARSTRGRRAAPARRPRRRRTRRRRAPAAPRTGRRRSR